MKNIVDALKALSDETRLRIINLLYEKELCVCDIMEVLQITQAKASRHLNYLKHAELVSDRKQAQWVYYKLLSDNYTEFIDKIVFDNLRQMPMFKSDLESLYKWLENKQISCN